MRLNEVQVNTNSVDIVSLLNLKHFHGTLGDTLLGYDSGVAHSIPEATIEQPADLLILESG